MNLYEVTYKVTKNQDQLSDADTERLNAHVQEKCITHVKAESFKAATTKAFKTELKGLLVVNSVSLSKEGVKLV